MGFDRTVEKLFSTMEIFQLIGGVAGIAALIGLGFQWWQLKDTRKLARPHLAGNWKLFRMHDGTTVALRLALTNNGATSATHLATRTWLELRAERVGVQEQEDALGYLGAHGGQWLLVVPLAEDAWDLFNRRGAHFHSEIHYKDEFGKWWVWETVVRQNHQVDPGDVETVDGPRIRVDDDPPPWSDSM